jgi:signal transduction histidine kinase
MPFSPPSFRVKRYVFLFLLQACCCLLLPAQDFSRRIDSLKGVVNNAVSDENYIHTCFKIADDFMEINLYDSAQLWLNRIAEKLPLREPSLDNYFLSSRQAEVYYYNGLQRLGLQESERSLSIAEALKDSLLLADAYNFLGLFYINLDSSRRSISYFKKGIQYARQPPYPAHYLSLTKPHHLYGNMAEAYEKLHQYDSSIYLSHISLKLATEIGWKRGIAVAHNNLGKSFLEMGNADSAFYHYQLSRLTTLDSDDFDVELLDCGGMAKAEDLRQHKENAMDWLHQGFMLIRGKPSVNNLFAGYFLDDAISLYKKYGEQQLLADALQMKAQLLQQLMKDNNRQVNVILNAGLQNETRLLNLQVKEARQRNEIVNTRLYLLLSLLVIVIAAFLLYRYKSGQKLQIARLQNKISQDLHDDIGSSLSSLQVYSSVAGQVMDAQPDKAKEMLRRITNESATLMDNIGDIVWSMKTEKEQTINLDSRIKNFISDVLGAANIHYTIHIEEGIDGLVKNMTARKNILLIIKEAVNNTLRHAQAKQVSVSVKKLAGRLLIQVADNGKGFNSELAGIGDGLNNMRKRAEELNGIFELSTNPGKGTTISALFPLTNISDTA